MQRTSTSVRLSKTELARVARAAKRLGCTPAEFIRVAASKAADDVAPPAASQLEIDLLRQAAKDLDAPAFLDALARYAEIEGDAEAAEQIRSPQFTAAVEKMMSDFAAKKAEAEGIEI